MVMDYRLLVPGPVPGLMVAEQPGGFLAELTASAEAFSAVRALARWVASAYGIDAVLGESAELVLSELTGNVVRSSVGDEPVPLIVEVYAVPRGVEVVVHDALPGRPHRRSVALDSAEETSGRGVHLLDLLTERWTVESSPLGKKTRCLLTE
ncbi:ATP-binding protein [Streptomyces sp. NPDC058739]|uniref:ATP-binding protein n=1 Tax=Streptomyces sp. NPDC058739 TaxID=3346618 RepID=UPI0036A69579